MRLAKGLKKFLLIGLLVILLLAATIVTSQGMGIKNKIIITVSKYRNLLPYIVAQAKLESNNFRSKVYLTDHNMFGMKVGSSGKPGLLSPEGDHYRHYENDAESVIALLEWLDRNNFPTTVSSSDEYASELKNRRYFTAGLASYQANLKFWLDKN
jgi:hypothetical protein